MQTAIAYEAHGPVEATITSNGSVWYRLDAPLYLRTHAFTATRGTGVTISRITIWNASGQQVTTCDGNYCQFLADSTGPYFIQVSGTSNGSFTLSSVDGSTQELAYGPFTGGTGLYHSGYVPTGSDGWFKTNLGANTFYGIESSKAAAIEVYQGSVLIASGTGSWLNFTTPAIEGMYHIKVTASDVRFMTVVNLYSQGVRKETAFPYTPHGPVEGSLGSASSVWFKLDNLVPYRTLILAATPETGVTLSNITIEDASGYQYASCATTTCSFLAYKSGPYYLKVSGTGSGRFWLSSLDGSTQELAYAAITSAGYAVPANSVGWFKWVSLSPNTFYGIESSGAKAIEVYQGSALIASGTGSWLNFTTTPTKGTYHAKVTMGSRESSAGVTLYGQGVRKETAFPYTPHGPVEGSLGSASSVWFKLDNLVPYRTLVLTATTETGVTLSNITIEDASGYQYVSCATTTCSFLAYKSGPYYLKVSGTGSGRFWLSSLDGSTRELAYAAITSAGYVVPANSVGWFKRLSLSTNTPYTVNAPGVAEIAIYQGETLIATVPGATLTFTTPETTGTYYVKVTAGSKGFSAGVTFYR